MGKSKETVIGISFIIIAVLLVFLGIEKSGQGNKLFFYSAAALCFVAVACVKFIKVYGKK